MAEPVGGFDVGGVSGRLHAFTAAVRTQAALGLRDAAEFVLAESSQLVPHELGNLQDSGRTDVDEDALVAAVSYDTPYAVVQHERMDYHHDAGRQAKYLEQPLTSSNKEIRELIARRVGKAFQ